MKMKLKHFAPIVLGTALTGCASQAPKLAQAEISQASLIHLSVAESEGAIAGEDAVAKEARLSDVYAELREAYIEKIRTTLLAAWADSGAAGHACKLKISQLPGGAILQADALMNFAIGSLTCFGPPSLACLCTHVRQGSCAECPGILGGGNWFRNGLYTTHIKPG